MSSRPTLFLILLSIVFSSPADAKPDFMSGFNDHYPNSPWVNNCIICHPGTGGATDYRHDWTLSGRDFAAIENLDSDGDGIANIDEIEAGTNPGEAETGPGQTPVVKEGGFYHEAYLSANFDLPRSWGKAECINHYKLFGFLEKRATHFDLEEYLNANPDLPANWTLVDALNHYRIYGKFENRLLAFDAQEYLSLYPDLPQNWNYDQAYNHYIYFGRNEERVPSFDETAYLEMYSDLPGEWGEAEAFNHYMHYGRNEGRVYDPYDEKVFTE